MFSLTIFLYVPILWDLLSKSERHQVKWLIENRHGIQWEDGMVLYWMAESVVYVKGHEEREWLRNLLLDEARRAVYVENIEAHYRDIESSNKLDVTHTFCC